jgi:hypothetical protein
VIEIGEVDGTYVRVHPLGDEVDDVSKRLFQVVGAGDDAGDVGE